MYKKRKNKKNKLNTRREGRQVGFIVGEKRSGCDVMGCERIDFCAFFSSSFLFFREDLPSKERMEKAE